MTGETDVTTLIRSMQPELRAENFVFLTLPIGCAVPPHLAPIMVFREKEGSTLIVEEAEARRTGFWGTFRCRMITLNVHSSLHAVGFLAAITGRLATAGIAVNAVSAYYHDHLFVPADHADEAYRILQQATDKGAAQISGTGHSLKGRTHVAK
jgi:uncharacterized protein